MSGCSISTYISRYSRSMGQPAMDVSDDPELLRLLNAIMAVTQLMHREVTMQSQMRIRNPSWYGEGFRRCASLHFPYLESRLPHLVQPHGKIWSAGGAGVAAL
ncbi:hypothetical protein AcW1_001999 [Taiwanofungus camphoratus]|nr:hypothetical protein AcW1_001999 [Antrodia cinnamomea]